MRQIKIKVLANSIDRIDQYIINQIKEQHEDLTRSKLKKLLLKNKLLLNGETIKKFTQKLNLNDEITIIIDEAVESDIMANNIEIDSIYEDNDIIIINKQKNLQTHPGGKNRQNTLVNALLYHYHDQLSGIGGVIRPGIVHRLDKNTTGLMVIAKNDFAHIKISEQLQNRSLKRTYLALTFAVPSKLKDNIETFIEIHPTKRSLRRISKKNGKKAITFYEVIEKYYEQNFALIKCNLQTGRTHQIRLHLSHIGHSIIGDPDYGNNLKKINNIKDIDLKNRFLSIDSQLLHAYKLELIHPSTNKLMKFEARLPNEFLEIINYLKTK